MPRFQTEAEEAKWWNDRMDVNQARLVQGIKTGNVQRGGPKRVIRERQESKNITIRVAVADIERARTLAAQKGVGYQTLMNMLLKEALDRESGGKLADSTKKVRRPSLT